MVDFDPLCCILKVISVGCTGNIGSSIPLVCFCFSRFVAIIKIDGSEKCNRWLDLELETLHVNERRRKNLLLSVMYVKADVNDPLNPGTEI